jgi:hypothetical protein
MATPRMIVDLLIGRFLRRPLLNDEEFTGAEEEAGVTLNSLGHGDV